MFNVQSLSRNAIDSASRIEGATVIARDQMMQVRGGAETCFTYYVCNNFFEVHECDYPDNEIVYC